MAALTIAQVTSLGTYLDIFIYEFSMVNVA